MHVGTRSSNLAAFWFNQFVLIPVRLFCPSAKLFNAPPGHRWVVVEVDVAVVDVTNEPVMVVLLIVVSVSVAVD